MKWPNLTKFDRRLILTASLLTGMLSAGCASLCKEGSATRFICDDHSIHQADLEARAKREEKEREAKVWKDYEDRQAAENELSKRAQRDAEEQARIEVAFGIRFCQNPDLFAVVFMSQDRLEGNCIYGVGKAPLRVLQAQSGGIIVVPISSQMNPLDRAIYIKTTRQFADGDLVQSLYLKTDGVFAYINTMGARRTLKSFRHLGDR